MALCHVHGNRRVVGGRRDGALPGACGAAVKHAPAGLGLEGDAAAADSQARLEPPLQDGAKIPSRSTVVGPDAYDADDDDESKRVCLQQAAGSGKRSRPDDPAARLRSWSASWRATRRKSKPPARKDALGWTDAAGAALPPCSPRALPAPRLAGRPVNTSHASHSALLKASASASARVVTLTRALRIEQFPPISAGLSARSRSIDQGARLPAADCFTVTVFSTRLRWPTQCTVRARTRWI